MRYVLIIMGLAMLTLGISRLVLDFWQDPLLSLGGILIGLALLSIGLQAKRHKRKHTLRH